MVQIVFFKLQYLLVSIPKFHGFPRPYKTVVYTNIQTYYVVGTTDVAAYPDFQSASDEKILTRPYHEKADNLQKPTPITKAVEKYEGRSKTNTHLFNRKSTRRMRLSSRPVPLQPCRARCYCPISSAQWPASQWCPCPGLPEFAGPEPQLSA